MGNIPNEFNQLYQLEELFLNNNQFSGDISHVLFDKDDNNNQKKMLSNSLKILYLNQNKFDGVLPTSLKNLSQNIEELSIK